MRARILLAFGLGLGAALPAMAQDHPHIMRPARDVMVEYRASSGAAGQRAPDMIRMYFTDHGMKLRIEPVGKPGYSIMDRSTGRMIIVMEQQHAYMEMPYDTKRIMAFDDDKDATFKRVGTDTIAGIGCTVYDARVQARTGQVCVTDDGLLLRARSDNPGSPNGGMEALKVTYGAQPASLFAPPPDYQRMDMSNMMHGAPQGNGH